MKRFVRRHRPKRFTRGAGERVSPDERAIVRLEHRLLFAPREQEVMQMTSNRVRLGVAIALVGATLALGRPARADGDGEDSKKCDCVSWWGHNGNWQFVGDIPMQLCVKTDCWVPLAN